MRSGIYLITFMLLVISNLLADEFVIDKFNLDEKDLSARTEPKTDINDEFCAIIKVRTDLEGIRFISNQLEDMLTKNNEYWLYVSPGIKQFDIIKPGFITTSYEIPTQIISSTVYIMEMTNKEQTRLNVISFPVSSNGSQIFINGQLSEFKTPHMFKIDPGKYFVSVQHPDFDEMTKDITLKEMETRELVFNLSRTNIIKLQQKQVFRNKKRLGFIGGIAIASAGITFNYLAEQAYDKAHESTSTSVVDKEWDKYQQYNSIRNVSYSISILPFMYGTYNWIKEIKL